MAFMYSLTRFVKDGNNDHKKDAIDVASMAARVVKRKYASILY